MLLWYTLFLFEFALRNPWHAGLYRSGYPNKKNFPFLIKLGIKTVVYLGEERYLEKNKACLQGYGIQIFQFKMEGNLEPFSEISRDVLVQALECVL